MTLRGQSDSPRWCGVCNAWGNHHTDRCANAVVGATRRLPTTPALIGQPGMQGGPAPSSHEEDGR